MVANKIKNTNPLKNKNTKTRKTENNKNTKTKNSKESITKNNQKRIIKNSKDIKKRNSKGNGSKGSQKKESNLLLLRATLLFAGFLSLINVGFMYTVANPTAGFALQGILSVALIFYAIFFKNIPKKIHIGMTILFLIPLAFSLFLGIYGNRNHVNHTEDVVIVLGAGVNGTFVSRPLAHRLNTAADYWFQNPDSMIIVTGGLGNRAIITEAEAMANFLIQRRGVPEDRILLEDLSTSTYENLVFAKEIAYEYFPDGFTAVLVTNDFHVYRGVRTARNVGIEVNPLGAYTDWYTWPVNYLREMMAVVYFKLINMI